MQRSVNPFNGEQLAEYPSLTRQQLSSKLQLASAAYKGWRMTSFQRRSDLMTSVSLALTKNKDSLARLISLEMGKVLHESLAEVQKCADACLFYADQAERFLADERIQTEAFSSFVTYQSTGPILAVMPWNFPFWQVFRFAAPVLMAGNVALLKHSSNVPQCSLAIENIFREAGFPDDVFQSLLIDNDLVETILSDDIVQGVALTGSEKAGSHVASVAGKHIKKSVLELGGSDPFIVLADADLDKTVKVAVQSRMQNAGQSCIAAKRFIVEQRVKEEFVSRFAESIRQLKQGDPLAEGTTTGPMARTDLAEDLEKQLRQSERAGAKLVVGGLRDGANFKPALMDHVRRGMPGFDEETFGPLAAVVVARDENEAIELANTSRYGLGASVWTSDLERGERVAREIQSGTVYVNSMMRSDARLPFGGIKKSGYGRELARQGILEFVNVKTISVNAFESGSENNPQKSGVE